MYDKTLEVIRIFQLLLAFSLVPQRCGLTEFTYWKFCRKKKGKKRGARILLNYIISWLHKMLHLINAVRRPVVGFDGRCKLQFDVDCFIFLVIIIVPRLLKLVTEESGYQSFQKSAESNVVWFKFYGPRRRPKFTKINTLYPVRKKKSIEKLAFNEKLQPSVIAFSLIVYRVAGSLEAKANSCSETRRFGKSCK